MHQVQQALNCCLLNRNGVTTHRIAQIHVHGARVVLKQGTPERTSAAPELSGSSAFPGYQI